MPTFRLVQKLPFCVALAALAACGKGGSSGPDADLADAVPTGPCVEFLAPSAVVSSYPGSVSGDVAGAGADFTVAEMACSKELDYFDPAGEDLVVRLESLTPGTTYAVSLQSAADLSFYVTQGCTEGAIAEGDCLLFSDLVEDGAEVGDFTAPSSGEVFVVIDHFPVFDQDNNLIQIPDGSFTLDAYESECEVNADCTADASKPFCDALQCVSCTNSFHCEDTASPVCDNDLNVCVAGHDQCTGDDPSPPENADDGPSGAVTVVAAAGVPGVVNAKICGLPNTGSDLIAHQDAEVDFYKFELLADEKRGVSLTWATSGDLDLYLFDADGTPLDTSFFGSMSESLVIDGRPAGTYYLAVAVFDDAADIPAAAVDYTLTLTFPECDTNFDCLLPENPVCGPSLVCEPPGDLCSTDDLLEPNDGPSSATPLVSGVEVSGLICNTPTEERDYFSITVADGDNLEVSLSYIDAVGVDLDVTIFSADGTLHGTSFYLNPEVVSLTFLPAGSYIIEVAHVGGATAVSHAYDLTATVTATAGCVTTADCAAVYSTQVYRGQCQGAAETNPGACVAIEGAAALALGDACDSGDDCTSGFCSNLIFQRGADSSVCTIACVADATCTGAHGAGFSCTLPFANNKCHPNCVGDLDCGAIVNFNPPDAGEPWYYLVCNVGVCELGM